MHPLPRLLVLIGSGETAPSMAPLHRDVLARLGGAPRRAAILDTPYGFQENAAEITAAAVTFFERRLGAKVSVASMRRSDGDPLARRAALDQLREADYVFSGPGSPTYALRHWSGTEVPGLLAEKLATGGAIVMASAAALTLGRLTPPIYEIYKVGAEPHWLPGLDLLAPYGLPVVVLPHFDNTEGRSHDTRYCFLGERRLFQLEAALPDDAFILGIDEHTALILDLETGRATIRGRGGVTVRRRGRSVVFGPDDSPSIDDLRAAADADTQLPPRPLAPPAARAHADEAASADRTAAARLAPLVQPLIEALLEARASARASGDFAAADAIRDRLRPLGVELHDAPDGTTWSLPEG